MRNNRKIGPTILLLLAVFASLFAVPDTSALDNTETILGAHRGSSVEFIENTVEAFEEALKDDKYQFIELDIQYTKDKQIVVYHDLSLSRLQKKNDEISELTYDELIEISDYKIPLYSEMIDIIGSQKPVNVEIKSQGNLKDDQMLVDWVVKDANVRGIIDTIIISSISADVVKYSNIKYPNIKIGKIYWVMPMTYIHSDYLTEELFKETQELGADYLMLHGINLLNFEKLMKLKPDNLKLAFWYFNDEMYLVDDNL